MPSTWQNGPLTSRSTSVLGLGPELLLQRLEVALLDPPAGVVAHPQGEVGVGELAELALLQLAADQHPVIADVPVWAAADHVLDAGVGVGPVGEALRDAQRLVQELLGQVLHRRPPLLKRRWPAAALCAGFPRRSFVAPQSSRRGGGGPPPVSRGRGAAASTA